MAEPIFTPDQFQTIVRWLHPDSRMSTSDEMLARAFVLVANAEFALTGKRAHQVQPRLSVEPLTSLPGLYRRGWTKDLVRELLGSPDC
jgi:hypothetical protein